MTVDDVCACRFPVLYGFNQAGSLLTQEGSVFLSFLGIKVLIGSAVCAHTSLAGALSRPAEGR